MNRLNAYILDLVVRTNHLEVNHTFAINGLTEKGSHEIEFDFDGTPVSVLEYFRRSAKSANAGR